MEFIKVAVIGVGNNGRAKVQHLVQSELVDEIVVHDVDQDRAAAVAEPLADLGAAYLPS